MSLGSASRNGTADVKTPAPVAFVDSFPFPAGVPSARARHGECEEPQVGENTSFEGSTGDDFRSGVDADPPATLAPASVPTADQLQVRASAGHLEGSEPCPVLVEDGAIALAAAGSVPAGWQPSDGHNLAGPRAGWYPADRAPVESSGSIDPHSDDAAGSAPTVRADKPAAGAGPANADAIPSLPPHPGIEGSNACPALARPPQGRVWPRRRA